MTRQHAVKFITIAAGFVLTQFSLILYLPSQNLIAHDLGLSQQTIAYTLSTALAGYAFGQLWWGTLSDVIGRKQALISAAIGGGLAAIAIPYCHGAIMFNLTLAMLTFCQAAYTSIGYALIHESFPAHQTARVIASIGILMAITPVIAPLMNTIITTYFGWHMLFWGLAGYSACLILGIITQVPTSTHTTINPISRSAFNQLYHNRQYLRFCLSLALGFSAFIVFQQYAPELIGNLLHTTPDTYAYIYAIATAPYLLSTMSAKKCLHYFSINQISTCGLYLLSSGYGLTLIAAIWPHAAMSPPIAWLGIIISMAGTGIIMPISKIGAITSVTSHIGTAASIMKFTQVGASILVTWLAASLLHNGQPQYTLSILTLCAICATIISKQLPQQTQLDDSPA